MDTITARPAATSASGRPRRPLLIGAVVLLAVVALTALAFAGLRFARPGALPGTTVNGVAVGGLQGDGLHRAIAGAGAGDVEVIVVRGSARWQATGTELGYTIDVEETAERVLQRGRQLNPFTALGDHLGAFRGTTEVPPSESVDEEVLVAELEKAAEVLGLEPAEGTLEISGTTVTRVDPQVGAALDTEALTGEVRGVLLDGAAPVLDAPVTDVTPETTTAAVDAVLALAERAVSGPVELVREGTAITFSAEEIGDLLNVEQDGSDLGLSISAGDVARLVPSPTIAALEANPRDAEITLAGGVVSITESAEGFAFDAEATAAQLLAVATGDGPRTAELDGEVVEPELSTEEARELGITEQVSTFTTNFPCCQSRVTNIHRIADIVDGVVIKPGETFSVNDHVGERTRAKGFADGGAIQNGVFVQEVGGGVSQFATTIFNAAFFGGYAIPDYKAHSYYISRYPVGREATLNYPTVDLKVRNNSPHGILIDTSHTGTSITVSFWGTTWVEVSDITGERRNFSSPQTRTEENPNLRPGASRVTESGGQGFDITVTRVLRFPDGREEREEFFTRYLAQPRVVERNSSSTSSTPPPSDDGGSAPPPPPEDQPDPPAEDPPAEGEAEE
jgi:vancomycin resistance protein YoaR